ncbi:hypothetical protein ABB37_03832 [Leptomonas pyrrhocoris]|uniref:Uncharacterized protein n=1 Tax=Leptomonas pyrrhocoris TaxID=157538 RepID=A0A0M9G3A0_LEPPY|nr:hypothetical protein ABB37_03832 [Leptomonas pyrrhocoris]KPA81475.1 hypothetical protein ABB37_03832 [Leptomonas pyrrhocoris]|eukprot:XP_015659914.1 hypothetical protein ABB37_03832 [Leptomonas pyrrhocoris]
MSSSSSSSTSRDESSTSSRPAMNALAPYTRDATKNSPAPDPQNPNDTPSSADEENQRSDSNADGDNGADHAEDGQPSPSDTQSDALSRPRDEAFDEVERRARVALENISAGEGSIESRLGEYVDVLQSYRSACQERAMYHEAFLVQQVLRNLRLNEESRHVRGITEQQMEERRVLEEAHREEFREFHHSWNARIDAFEEEQLEAEISLLERQNNELIQFQEDMRDYQPRLLKYSRSLLESRAKQKVLARQRDYIGAQTQKEKADAIEIADMERYEGARQESFERREHALRHRHQQELLALRTKVESRRLYLERYRKQELDVLLQRYINVRRSMESQQNIVRNKTGTLLLKHACNMKTDNSGMAVLVESAGSGAFGSVVQRRQADELRAAQSQGATATSSSNGEV